MSTTKPATVPLPSPKKLKRSATAASLPTPPRTQRRRRRVHKGPSLAGSDSDRGARSSDTAASDDELPVVKKRRLDTVLETNDEDGDSQVIPTTASAKPNDQDAFWLGKTTTPGTALKSANTNGWSSSEEEEDDELPLLTRRRTKANSDAASDYASPPPSHRKPAAKPKLNLVKPPPPQPQRRSPRTPRKPKNAIPIRDSPNNPFLDSPPASESTNASPGTAGKADHDDEEEESATVNIGDKPTVALVHRGIRREFPNPFHDPKTGRAKPVNPNSLLPPEHPDFEPDFTCLPKVLFPGTGGKKRAKSIRKRAAAAAEGSARRRRVDSSDDEAADKSHKSAGSAANPLLMAPGPRLRRHKVDDSW